MKKKKKMKKLASYYIINGLFALIVHVFFFFFITCIKVIVMKIEEKSRAFLAFGVDMHTSIYVDRNMMHGGIIISEVFVLLWKEEKQQYIHEMRCPIIVTIA